MKNIISSIAKKMGYTIVKSSTYQQKKTKEVQNIENKASLLDMFYANIKAAGFNPSFIIDIGSNTGTWTRKFLENFPNTKILMVEPQERLKPHFEDLLSEKVQILNVGVGDKNDILKFTIADRDDSCSFIYSEEEAKEMGLDQIDIPIKTLDTIIEENNLPIPNLVKIDAEGLDVEVIKGASSILGKTEIILVETTVTCPTYKNTTTAMIKLMDEKGYQIYEITDLNRPFPKTPVLWLIEIAFVKKDSKLLNVKIEF